MGHDVLCPLFQHHAQIGVALSGDVQLRFTLPGVPSGRLQPNETASISALSKFLGSSNVSTYVNAISVPTPFTCLSSAVSG